MSEARMDDGGTFLWKPLLDGVEFVNIGWTDTDGIRAGSYHSPGGIALDFMEFSEDDWQRAVRAFQGGSITVTFRMKRWHWRLFGLTPPPSPRYIRHLRARRPVATSLRYRAWRCVADR